MSDFGSFQILIKQTDAGATGAQNAGNTAVYPLDLAGNYRLTLKGFQLHIFPEVLNDDTFPVEIYSPNFTHTYGNVAYPTFLYPIDPNNRYSSGFDMRYNALLQSDIRIQIRDARTHAPVSNMVFSVLNFEYEKI